MATSRKGSTTPKELKEDAGGLVAGGGPDLSGTASQPSQPPASKPRPGAAGTGTRKKTAEQQPDAASKPRSRSAAKDGARDEGAATPSAGPGAVAGPGPDATRPSDGATPDGSGGARMSDEERQRRIAERAYQKAQERGFSGDRQLDDWLEAEREHNTSEGRSS